MFTIGTPAISDTDNFSDVSLDRDGASDTTPTPADPIGFYSPLAELDSMGNLPNIQGAPTLDLTQDQPHIDANLNPISAALAQLPNAASTVFSTFSNIIKGSGSHPRFEEQSQTQSVTEPPQEPAYGYMYAANSDAAAPPPSFFSPSDDSLFKKTTFEPMTNNTFRLGGNKKKTYAHIPGLSTNQQTQAALQNFNSNSPMPPLPPQPAPVMEPTAYYHQDYQAPSTVMNDYGSQQQAKEPEKTNKFSLTSLLPSQLMEKIPVTKSLFGSSEPAYDNHQTSYNQDFGAMTSAYSEPQQTANFFNRQPDVNEAAPFVGVAQSNQNVQQSAPPSVNFFNPQQFNTSPFSQSKSSNQSESSLSENNSAPQPPMTITPTPQNPTFNQSFFNPTPFPNQPGEPPKIDAVSADTNCPPPTFFNPMTASEMFKTSQVDDKPKNPYSSSRLSRGIGMYKARPASESSMNNQQVVMPPMPVASQHFEQFAPVPSANAMQFQPQAATQNVTQFPSTPVANVPQFSSDQMQPPPAPDTSMMRISTNQDNLMKQFPPANVTQSPPPPVSSVTQFPPVPTPAANVAQFTTSTVSGEKPSTTDYDSKTMQFPPASAANVTAFQSVSVNNVTQPPAANITQFNSSSVSDHSQFPPLPDFNMTQLPPSSESNMPHFPPPPASDNVLQSSHPPTHFPPLPDQQKIPSRPPSIPPLPAVSYGGSKVGSAVLNANPVSFFQPPMDQSFKPPVSTQPAVSFFDSAPQVAQFQPFQAPPLQPIRKKSDLNVPEVQPSAINFFNTPTSADLSMNTSAPIMNFFQPAPSAPIGNKSDFETSSVNSLFSNEPSLADAKEDSREMLNFTTNSVDGVVNEASNEILDKLDSLSMSENIGSTLSLFATSELDATSALKSSSVQFESMIPKFLDTQQAADNTRTTASPAHSKNYRPVYRHWFYQSLYWHPFAMSDSLALDDALMGGKEIVITDGGRFEVDLKERRRSSVYWSSGSNAIRRCSWFYKNPNNVEANLLPFEESTADFMESEYEKAISSNSWNHQIALPNSDKFLLIKDPINIEFHDMGQALVVKRGVDEFVIDDGEEAPVDHLIVSVSNFGDKIDDSGELNFNLFSLSLISSSSSADELRSKCMETIQHYYSEAFDCGQVGRVEVLPLSLNSVDVLKMKETNSIIEAAPGGNADLMKSSTYQDVIMKTAFYCHPHYYQVKYSFVV